LKIIQFACKLINDLFVLVDEKLDKLQQKIKILEEGMNSMIAIKIDKTLTEQKKICEGERQSDQVRFHNRKTTA